MPGKSLRMFVAGDSPRSIKKITEFNWSGHAFLGTREQLKQIFKRPESEGTGVYFLLSGIDTDMAQMYVGETENFSRRIKNHNTNKDWWTHFIVFQSEGSSLNKAHVRYLEYVFWEKANQSTQIELMNDQVPKEPVLSEEDLADLRIFEENILYIMEALNLSYFTRQGSSINSVTSDSAQEYFMKVPNTDLEATLVRSEESYILKSGSYLRADSVDSFEKRSRGYYKKWKQLISSDLVVKHDENSFKLLKDLEFSSPSAAGSMVRARPTNGATDWKNKSTNASIKEDINNNDADERHAA